MRIYYTSDLHGSEKCWKKFMVTPKHYQADIIIIGGDITGKFIVPIIRLPNGRVEATFMGRKRKCKKEKDIEVLKQQIADTGQYWLDVTQEEYQDYTDNPSKLDEIFDKLITERVAEWVAMADERLKDQDVRCFISGGNDDSYSIDQVLEESETIEIFGLSNSNMTPWNCPRDISEEELADKIENLAGQIKNPDRAIFDIHVPPYGTGIDEAPELTEDMRMVMDSTGTPNMVPVGSTAVKEAILKYQPMLGLHGHIHEAAGIRKLGKTTIVNPGSEYAEGLLRGVVIDLDAQEGLINVNLVTG
jgi:Icc-related predicted phosphoesterase